MRLPGGIDPKLLLRCVKCEVMWDPADADSLKTPRPSGADYGSCRRCATPLFPAPPLEMTRYTHRIAIFATKSSEKLHKICTVDVSGRTDAEASARAVAIVRGGNTLGNDIVLTPTIVIKRRQPCPVPKEERRERGRRFNFPMPDTMAVDETCIRRIVFDLQRDRIDGDEACVMLIQVLRTGKLPEEYFDGILRTNVRLDDVTAVRLLQRRCGWKPKVAKK